MKKLSIFICGIILLSLTAFPFSASAEEKQFSKSSASSQFLHAGVSPLWVSVVSMNGAIEPGLLGTYKAYGSVTPDHLSYKLTVTCTIQQLVSSKWTDTDITWSKTGTGVVEASKSWISLSSGNYRIKVEATVYNASGSYVETATSYVGNYTVSG